MMGPWTPHWPPPEGTKKFTTPADRKVKNGKVVWLEKVEKRKQKKGEVTQRRRRKVRKKKRWVEKA